MKNESYEEFVEKFKPKKTTDDCYTPPLVFDAVKNWACAEYGISEKNIIRPFWPGGNYEEIEYFEGAVVVDNPPFSILSIICNFYLERNIKFFLFAPHLTFLNKKNYKRMNHIICGADIVYENGACVATSFVTNLGDGNIVVQTAPTLYTAVEEAVKKIKKTKKMPKYRYPKNVLTSSMLKKISEYGIDFYIAKEECEHISKLDAQNGKTIFGGGLLISNSAAERKEAAEKEAAEKEAENEFIFELSEREKEKILILEKEYAESRAKNQ